MVRPTINVQKFTSISMQIHLKIFSCDLTSFLFSLSLFLSLKHFSFVPSPFQCVQNDLVTINYLKLIMLPYRYLLIAMALYLLVMVYLAIVSVNHISILLFNIAFAKRSSRCRIINEWINISIGDGL